MLALVKSYGPRPFRWLVSAYIELFRCTPNLLWILFIYFTVQGVDIFISTLAFTLFTPRPFRWLVSAYIELFRCTPNLLWILFIYFTVQGVDIFISTLAFTLFTSAVMAEIVRAGLNAVPAGQFEAAQSQGFGFFATMRYIILPQTFRIITPALFGQCTTVIKDSSYMSGINVSELMYTTNVLMAHSFSLDQVLMLYGCLFALSFSLNFGISLLVRRYQRMVAAA